MMQSLLNLPKQVNDLLTRLSATWAAKLDGLRTGLTDTRMEYLDKLNITGNVAAASDLAAVAQEDNPLLSPPMTSGITGGIGFTTGTSGIGVSLSTHKGGGTLATYSMSSSTFADAVNITGAGVLEFAAAQAGAASAATMEVLIDGNLMGTITPSIGANNTGVMVGAVSRSQYWNGLALADNPPVITLGSVPFRTSLRIRIKADNNGNSVLAAYKYRRSA